MEGEHQVQITRSLTGIDHQGWIKKYWWRLLSSFIYRHGANIVHSPPKYVG